MLPPTDIKIETISSIVNELEKGNKAKASALSIIPKKTILPLPLVSHKLPK